MLPSSGLPEPLETASTLHLTLCTIKGRQITAGITGKRWRGKQRLHGAPQASSARQSNAAYVLHHRASGTVIGLQWLPSWKVSKSGGGWNYCCAPAIPGAKMEAVATRKALAVMGGEPGSLPVVN